MKAILQPKELPKKQRRLILGGLGGIGKTQLAVAFATQHYQDDSSVFWIDASSEDAVKKSFRVMADTVFDVRDPAIMDAERSVVHTQRWLSDPQNTRWLLIFDNHDDPESYSIERYYPHALHGSIIITTRRPDLVVGQSIQLQPLQSIEEQLAILETRSNRNDAKSGKFGVGPRSKLLTFQRSLRTGAGQTACRSPFGFGYCRCIPPTKHLLF